MYRILVIDDDLDILSVVEILLSMKGYNVEVTAKGEEAFSRIEKFKPHLILLDVLISGHDGRVICQQIKTNESTSHIPVIMFSGHPGAVASISQHGADDFLSKPFDANKLIEKIEMQLEKVKL
jgi:DNA-binding response OmpR family regulator